MKTSKFHPTGVDREINADLYQNTLDVFDDSVRRYRSKIAFSNMGEELTFEQLDILSGHLASFFQNELKLQKGDRIAIQLPNLLQYPIALFAAHRAGLIVVNTNPLYTAPELKHQLQDSGAVAIVVLANFASTLEKILHETQIRSVLVTELGDQLAFPKNILINSAVKYLKKMVPHFDLPQSYGWTQAMQIGKQNPYRSVDLKNSDVAFLQYTGGTTGVSKGAVLTHRNIIANMMQICEWMKPVLKPGEEIIITSLPLYHIFSLTVNCMTFMKYGGENVLITNPRDISAFIKILKNKPFTVMTAVNTLLNALMNHPDFHQVNFSKTKLTVAGAMALQKSISERWIEKTKSPVFEGYGLTEASPVLTCNPINGGDIVGTIGVPLPSTEIKLVTEDGDLAPLGEAGELCARGPQIMREYYQKPDETKKVLKDGWLHTGDVAIQLENGFYKIVDRKKDMILVSGFNVYPNEVEEVIASHPKVLECAVIGVQDDKTGETIKAFIVKKDESLTADEVLNHARESLTGYKIPKQIEFRKELPKTNVGKILRRALRDQAG